jgi:flagellar biosynthesis/type III secretory pathway M-ring protein FliF/YscJ
MTNVDKSDLEAKLREIEGVVTEIEDDARSNARTVVIVAGVAVISIVALMIWRSRRSKIRVEVYKT